MGRRVGRGTKSNSYSDSQYIHTKKEEKKYLIKVYKTLVMLAVNIFNEYVLACRYTLFRVSILSQYECFKMCLSVHPVNLSLLTTLWFFVQRFSPFLFYHSGSIVSHCEMRVSARVITSNSNNNKESHANC